MLDRRALLFGLGEVVVSAGAVALALGNSPEGTVASATPEVRQPPELVEPNGGTAGHLHGSSEFTIALCSGRSALAARSANQVRDV
jgi:hypothetical protein